MAQGMNSSALVNSRWWFVVLVCDIFKPKFLWSAQHWTRVHIPAQSNSKCLANWTMWLAEHSDISFWKRNDTSWNETSSRLFHCHCWRGKILYFFLYIKAEQGHVHMDFWNIILQDYWKKPNWILSVGLQLVKMTSWVYLQKINFTLTVSSL